MPLLLTDSEAGPDSDAGESRWDESRQSRAVTTVTWMNHCIHEPDVDESRLEPAGPLVPVPRLQAILFALGQHAGSPYLCGTRCGVQNSVAELLNVPRAHLARGQAQVPINLPRYAGRSIIGNNGEISQLLPISTNYCLFLLISTYYRPTLKTVHQACRKRCIRHA